MFAESRKFKATGRYTQAFIAHAYCGIESFCGWSERSNRNWPIAEIVPVHMRFRRPSKFRRKVFSNQLVVFRKIAHSFVLDAVQRIEQRAR